MISLNIIPNAQGKLPDLKGKTVHQITTPISITGLAGGMTSGKPSVSFVFVLPGSEEWVFAETSLALFLSAADALKAVHGDPRE